MSQKRIHLTHCHHCKDPIICGVYCLQCAKMGNVCHMCGTSFEEVPEVKAQTCSNACYQSNWRLLNKDQKKRESNERIALQQQVERLKDNKIERLEQVVFQQNEIIVQQAGIIDKLKIEVATLNTKIETLQDDLSAFFLRTSQNSSLSPINPLPQYTDDAPRPNRPPQKRLSDQEVSDSLEITVAAPTLQNGRVLNVTHCNMQLGLLGLGSIKSLDALDDATLEYGIAQGKLPAQEAGRILAARQQKAPQQSQNAKPLAGANKQFAAPNYDDIQL